MSPKLEIVPIETVKAFFIISGTIRYCVISLEHIVNDSIDPVIKYIDTPAFVGYSVVCTLLAGEAF